MTCAETPALVTALSLDRNSGVRKLSICAMRFPRDMAALDSLLPSIDSGTSRENHSVQVDGGGRYRSLKPVFGLGGPCDNTVAEEVASLAVLDLDQPQVGIEARLASEEGIGFFAVDAGG